MAASCRSSALKKTKVVEMYFTDVNESYQLHLTPESCTCKAGAPLPYTTRIETPSQVWYDISEGKITGEEALFQHKFRVVGDFSLMLRFNDYFATPRREMKKYEKVPQKRSMLFMLLPWIAFWVTSPMGFSFGLYIPIMVSALIPLFSRRWKLTLYDTLSVFLVSVLSVLVMAGLDRPLLVSLSYGLFGLLWLGSLVTPIPLCAWYSSAAYGGDSAFGNPLFLRTNRILAAAWGGLYILTAIWTYFIMGTGLRHYIGLINNLCPALLGIFTIWFVGWHPPHYARGEIAR
jgi:putative sterol carrier protein